MEWFEYIIIVVAVSLVLLPIVLRIINKKRAIGVAPFLINYFVSAFCKNWRSYKL